jgi:hypothetical protein
MTSWLRLVSFTDLSESPSIRADKAFVGHPVGLESLPNQHEIICSEGIHIFES